MAPNFNVKHPAKPAMGKKRERRKYDKISVSKSITAQSALLNGVSRITLNTLSLLNEAFWEARRIE